MQQFGYFFLQSALLSVKLLSLDMTSHRCSKSPLCNFGEVAGSFLFENVWLPDMLCNVSFEVRSKYKWYLKTQFQPHTKHM